jgi:uncharacterized protein YjbI with pentapeptide repeats
MKYTFSEEIKTRRYSTDMYAIIEGERIAAYSEVKFEIPDEVRFFGSDQAYIFKGAKIAGGNFWGGNFWGGNFWGGNYKGGNFWGGDFWGGDFSGGNFSGGDFWGGDFWGGNFWGGNFWGGNFSGGDYRGGDFRGGNFSGGDFWGGDFSGGNFSGGNFRGGNFWGGNYKGGNFRGGNFWGGNYKGGDFWGGNYRGGDYAVTLLQIQGSRHFCYVEKTDEGRLLLCIGCHKYTIDEWKEQYSQIGENENYSPDEIAEYKEYILIYDRIYQPKNKASKKVKT